MTPPAPLDPALFDPALFDRALFDRALRLLVDHDRPLVGLDRRRRNLNRPAAQFGGQAGSPPGDGPHGELPPREDPDGCLLRRLSKAPTAGELYHRALQEVVRRSGATAALLAGRAGDDMYHVLAQHALPPELLRSLRRFALRPGDIVLELAVRRRPFWLSELLERPPELLPAPVLRGLLGQVGDALLVPLHHEGELTALLALALPEARRRDPALFATLRALHGPLGQVLHRAQLLYALERSEVQAQTTLAALQEGVIRMDPAGRILSANAAAYRVLGLPPGELERHSLLSGEAWEVYGADDRRMHPREFPVARALREERSVNGQLMRLQLHGRSLWLSVNAAPLREQGEVAGVVLSFADVTEAHTLRLRLEHQALHDPLTGLPGRRAFEQVLHQGGPGAVVLLDLDGFTGINSAHGLHAGDEVLRQVARRLGARDGDTVARLAADEFGVVLPGADLAAAQALAARFQAELQRPLALPGADGLRLTACAGVCASAEASGQERYRNASLALGAAKARGPGRVQVFHPELLARQQRRARVQVRLGSALDRQGQRQGLHLHYQPIVGPPGSAPHLEALARWSDPELGTVNPAEFVAVAETSGLMPRLGEAVLDMALGEAVRWSERLGTTVEVAVNVSASQLALPDFGRQVCAALKRSGADARQLTLEVTEAVLMQDTERVSQHLQSLRELGVRTALDDFGTGFSSLSLLHQLPIDTIKVDRSFVQNVHEHPRRQALLSALVAVSQALSTELVAEGVETPEELRALCALGYRRFQGYLFARPQAPGDALAALGEAQARARELTPPEPHGDEHAVASLSRSHLSRGQTSERE